VDEENLGRHLSLQSVDEENLARHLVNFLAKGG